MGGESGWRSKPYDVIFDIFLGGGWGTTRGADLKSYYKLCFEISIISFSIAIVSPIIIVYEIT